MTPLRDYAELGQFIPLHYHYNMLNDTVRMQGFKAALDYAVRPGAKVLELGGGTGVLSHFAARKAAKVWCVERNPELAAKAREILALNPHGKKIEVVEADAFDYLPPEPVDVVICEMLHVAMLREKQLTVISAFKERYLKKFGGPLPVFVPEAFIQAVQPVQQNFHFEEYYVPTILFQDPVAVQDKTYELAAPAVYQILSYDQTYPLNCAWNGVIGIERPGVLNALRFVTKNILAIVTEEQHTIDWHNQYLIVPLEEPLTVEAGDQLHIHFDYPAGASFAALSASLLIAVEAQGQREMQLNLQRPAAAQRTAAL
ncbi:MAG: methyltransferase domain-containing protein [Pseudomonadota bacterium]